VALEDAGSQSVVERNGARLKEGRDRLEPVLDGFLQPDAGTLVQVEIHPHTPGHAGEARLPRPSNRAVHEHHAKAIAGAYLIV